MGDPIELGRVEIDSDRQIDLILSALSTADRGMGDPIESSGAEIDSDRQIDLILSALSTADRSMGDAFQIGLHRCQELPHV